jgi:RNA polymerase sigma-70 factor, ECF subfamily
MIKALKNKHEKNKECEIYDAYAEGMMLLCYRYLGNMLDAEEVLHNGFIKVFSNLRKFRQKHEKSFGAWVKKIMINECLMFLRKKTNFELVSLDKMNDFEDKSIENNSIDTENCLELINNLPVGYKTVFNLFAIEGYSHKEIAAMLKINESTSRSQLTKARKLLQQKLLRRESLYG